MENLRMRALALPGPYQDAAMAMWKEARRTLEKYRGVQTAENQIRFDLATEIRSLEFDVERQEAKRCQQ